MFIQWTFSWSLTFKVDDNFHQISFANNNFLGREPWSSGYGRRLMIQRSCVRIPAPYTGSTFFIFICCINCNVCLKRWKKWKEAGDGPFKKELMSWVLQISRTEARSTKKYRLVFILKNAARVYFELRKIYLIWSCFREASRPPSSAWGCCAFFTFPVDLIMINSGCGSVGRAVASDTRCPRFKSSHLQKFIFLLNICLLSTVFWKDENKEKEAGYGPFFNSVTRLGHF